MIKRKLIKLCFYFILITNVIKCISYKNKEIDKKILLTGTNIYQVHINCVFHIVVDTRRNMKIRFMYIVNTFPGQDSKGFIFDHKTSHYLISHLRILSVYMKNSERAKTK